MGKIIRRSLILIIIAAIAFVGYQYRNYQKKIECRQNALLYFEEKDYEKAIDYLEEGLKSVNFFSKDVDKDMSCYLAESYTCLGETEKASKLYDRLIDKYPDEKMFYLLKGDMNLSADEIGQAIKVFEQGWKQTEDTCFLEKICDSYIQDGDFENALKYAEMGEKKGGADSADFLFKQIVIYENAQNYEAAYEAAEKYVKTYPDDERGQKELIFLSTRI